MLLQDLRYGLRTLRRSPGFTGAALVTLALGIGANAAIFSVVNAVLLRPLPYREPDRLVQLVRSYQHGPAAGQDGRRYLFFREHLRSLEALAAYRGAGSVNMVRGDRAEFVSLSQISKEYFAVFGVQPALGQPFGAEHDVAAGPPVAILSHALWQRSFGADPGVIGSSIFIADKPLTVIGVMPETFEPLTPADVFVPLRPGLTGPGGGFNYAVAGRLRRGTSLAQANADVAAVWHAFAEAFPGIERPNELPARVIPLQESVASPIRPAVLMMAAAVGVLLLIACANTANLLLARASGRVREIALRAALGAGRGRIVRQMLTESVLLSSSGAVAGLLIAYWSVPALLALTPPAYLPASGVRIDARVLIVTGVIAVVTGLLFGLAPAMTLARQDLVEAFKEDGVRSSGSRRSGWLRRVLVTAEVALCMLLLVAAGLLVQTFVRLRALDPGFDTHGVLTARMSLQGERYATPEALTRFYAEGLSRIRALPGVRAAAVVNGVPLERALNLNVDVLDGPEKIEDALTDWRYATPGYFSAMGIPIVAGRSFTDGDRAGAVPVAVVSEEFARRFFKGTPALGRHIRVYDADGTIEIVGIARDLKEGGLRLRPLPVMYVPVAQTHATAIRTTHSYFHVSWVIRADRPAAALVREIEEQIRAVDPRQPFSTFRTMDESRDKALAAERFQMTILGAFAGIGLMLAAAGVYGLIAYSVAQRSREFGIRMALGATPQLILGSVVREGLALALSGGAAGTIAALFATRVLRNFVWQVSTLDPATFAGVALLLLVVSAAASTVPALRAVRLDQAAALRE
jgi:putative ABC transport system permease protein